MQIGFSQKDFQDLRLPELYLRYALHLQMLKG